MTKADKEGQRKAPILRFKGFTDDWEQRKLGEIGKTYSGLSGKNKSDFEKGNSNFVTFLEVLNNPVLKNIDLTNKVEIKENEHQNKVKRNDILFNTSSETPEEVATSTVVDVNQNNLYLNSFCFGFRPNVQFSNYYIGYYLRSNHFRSRVFCLAQGISRYNISKKSLIKLKLSLPKLEEQDKISRIFNQIELLLTLYERKLKLLSQVKKYLLDNLFAEKEYPNLRFKGFTDAWEQRKLQNQVQFFSGLTYSPNDVKDVGTFVIRSSNIKDNTLVSADNVYVNPNIANSEPVKKDDVIMVVRNGSKSLIGKHALVTRKIDNTVIGAFMTGIRSSTPYFLDALLDTLNFKKEIYKNLGATINQITIGNLRKMTFKVPNESEKFKIGNLFKKLNYLLALYENKQQHLTEIKNTLLNTMFI